MKIGIVGRGFVGSAVYGAFKDHCKIYVADPKMNTTIKDDILPNNPKVIFVCVPTPYGNNGEIDSSIVESVLDELKDFGGLVVLKSTVIPSITTKLKSKVKHFIYNPEFLTESNAEHDFINARMHVFGGDAYDTHKLEAIYNEYSLCVPAQKYHMRAEEASYVKYGLNVFLAVKVLFLNQFKDTMGNNAVYETVINAMIADGRIGPSHNMVPGPDGKHGFGGACFTKDTAAFASFANGDFTLLNEAIRANNEIRAQYDLCDREKAQNVKYL